LTEFKVGARFVAEADSGRYDFIAPTAPQLLGLILREIRGWGIERLIPEDASWSLVDVGACIGSWSIPLARARPKCSVLCIEPYKISNECLRYNAKGISNLRVILAAADEKDGMVKVGLPSVRTNPLFRIFTTAVNIGQISVFGEPGKNEEIVQSFTLDHLAQHVDVLKIDVEGCERRVLDGAQRILTEDRPLIQIEMSETNLKRDGFSVERLRELIESYDYRLVGQDGLDDIYCPSEKCG